MWYKARVEIEVEVEATDPDSATQKIETLIRKRVHGQEFGHARNDRASVTPDVLDIIEITDDPQ